MIQRRNISPKKKRRLVRELLRNNLSNNEQTSIR